MENTLTRIVPIAIAATPYQRLLNLAERERTSVAKIACVGLETYLAVLTDEAILDQLRGVRPVPRSA